MTSTEIIGHVYADQTVEIYDTHIRIFKYYFPLATSKTIMFQDVEQIIVHHKEGVKPVWGTETKNLSNWFPLDKERKNKQDTFIELVLHDRSIRPCFSPKDPETCFKVLWVNHTKEGRAYNEQAVKKNAQLERQALEKMRKREEQEKQQQKQHEENDKKISQAKEQNRLTSAEEPVTLNINVKQNSPELSSCDSPKKEASEIQV